MVSGTCFHGKCVFLRVEHRLARPHVGIDDLGTFLAPFWHLQSTCWSFWGTFLPLFDTCSRYVGHFATFSMPFGTCSRHVDHSGGHFCFFLAPVVDMSIILAAPIMTTSESAANSTATMPVAYRQRLNGPNVKSTSGSTAGCSEFVVLLRGPGEQPGNARAEQHTNIRGQDTTEEEPCCRTTPLPWVSGPISIRESRSYWTAGGSRVFRGCLRKI